MSKKDAHALGLSVTKEEDFGEWYHQLVSKSGLILYTPVSGCYTLLPRSYFIWEQIQRYLDRELKKREVQNCYYPMFIPQRMLEKEKEHLEGFQAEVAWVTHGGKSKLEEPIAIRPTSETTMYSSFPQLINSYQDLPLKLNQWCNIVRWEFSHPTPFIRSREFLWQEGHTAHRSREEALEEVLDILKLYQETYAQLLAVPCLPGKKTEKEKFAGAEETYTLEGYIPGAGRGIQAATSHLLGQNFGKVFGIEYLDEKQKKQHPWQNSWGMTTRSIGVALMLHSDNRGLVLPPAIAEHQVVIIPIYKASNKEAILAYAQELAELLEEQVRVHLDLRSKKPGWKYNHWEMRGVPLRIEIGPRDLEKKQWTGVTRHDGERREFALEGCQRRVTELLNSIHRDLYEQAEISLREAIQRANEIEVFERILGEQNLPLINWCGETVCEETIRGRYEGIKSLCQPLAEELQEVTRDTCLFCERASVTTCLYGRSY